MRSLVLPSVPESVSVAVEAAEQAARESGLGEEAVSRASLVVAEAVANAVEHVPPSSSGAEVVFEAWTDGDALSLRVCDSGDGPSAQALETAALPADLLQTHGRGLYLIRVLSDHVWVENGCLTITIRERPA